MNDMSFIKRSQIDLDSVVHKNCERHVIHKKVTIRSRYSVIHKKVIIRSRYSVVHKKVTIRSRYSVIHKKVTIRSRYSVVHKRSQLDLDSVVHKNCE